jgi:hypothetical protein
MTRRGVEKGEEGEGVNKPRSSVMPRSDCTRDTCCLVEEAVVYGVHDVVTSQTMW